MSSGQLPRSTQYGKKIRLPNNLTLPNVNSNDYNKTLESGLSPFLGQPVIIEDQTFFNKNHDNFYEVESSISSLSDIESWDTGSTSSASWFDEFDQVSTQQINKELKDIDSVLYNEADVSILRSDLHEECREWKDAFPHLRINGTGVKHSASESRRRKVSTSDRNDSEDTKSFSVLSKTNPVFYHSKSLQSRSDRTSKDVSKSSLHNNTIEMESFLRISPILFLDASDKVQNSASSIVRSEITSSKWRRNTSPEFSSLPYIPPNNVRYHSSSINTMSSSSRESNSSRKTLEPLHTVIRKPHHQRSVKSGKSDHYYQTLPLRTKPLILPPIEQLSINNDSSNFRSISATPRNSIFYQGFSENTYKKTSTVNSKCTKIVEQNNKIYRNNVNNKDGDKNIMKPKSNYK